VALECSLRSFEQTITIIDHMSLKITHRSSQKQLATGSNIADIKIIRIHANKLYPLAIAQFYAGGQVIGRGRDGSGLGGGRGCLKLGVDRGKIEHWNKQTVS